MPHTFFKFEEGRFAQIAANLLGKAEVHVLNYADDKILEVEEKFSDQCPPPKVLNQLAASLNRIRSLNNTSKRKIDKIAKIPKKLDKPIKAGKVIVNILTHVLEAKLTAIGTPPGPAGGLIISERLGKVLAQSARLNFAIDTIDKLEKEKKAIQEMLIDTGTIFDPIESRIEQIEKLINECTANPELTKDERDQILDGIRTTVSERDSFIEEYRSESGRVYTLTIIDVLQPETDVTPKRQAIAKDFRGIVIMRGPESYASSPQILVDELKFKLDQLP